MRNTEHKSHRTPEIFSIDDLIEKEKKYWDNFLEQEAIIPPFPNHITEQDLQSLAAFDLTIVTLPQLLEPTILSKAVLPTLHKRYPIFIHQDKNIDFRKLNPDCMRMLPAQTLHSITWSPHRYEEDTYEIDFTGAYCGGWFAVEATAQPRLPYEAYQITELQRFLKLPVKRTGLAYSRILEILNASVFPYPVRLPRVDEWNLLAMRYGWAESNILEYTSTPIHVAGNGLQFPVNYVPVMGLGPEYDTNERKTGTGYTRVAHKHLRYKNIGYHLVVPLSKTDLENHERILLSRQLS